MTPIFLVILARLALQGAVETPPGMVLVPGGRTRIGIELEELERLLKNDAAAQSFAGALIAETPRHDEMIDAFYLMTTEVTAEQYAVYLRATGVRAPETWFEEAIQLASKESADEQARLAAEARAQHKPAPPKRTFDAHAWWLEHNREPVWKLADADRLRPVVFVDYEDARGYARWAGMRLMTEFEYERAVRGDSERLYPWGNEWDNEKFAATSLLKKKGGTFPVGSFPAGQSKQGVFDLAGNAWEWTSSPYVAFPGYQLKVFELGFGAHKRPVNAIADFNDSFRVVVGGSFQTPNLMCRATVRRGTDKTQSTGAIGFRCAASARPGADMAAAILESDLEPHVRPRTAEGVVEYAPAASVCCDGWASVPHVSDAPPGYAVIQGYTWVAFTPVKQVNATDIGTFEKKALNDEPVHLGFLSTSLRVIDPPLDPGTYVLTYRPRGKRRFSTESPAPTNPNEHAGAAPLEEKLHFDDKLDHVIVSDVRGTPLCALPIHIEYGPEHESRAESTTPGQEPGSENGAGTGAKERRIRFEVSLPCKTTKKAFLFTLDLRCDSSGPDVVWRR